jgi:hypothetical protein
MDIKHVGRVKSTGRKCLVAYRTLPGDAYSCLIVPTESLRDAQHDALINLVNSTAGQDAYEFAEVMARSTFPDGSIMLANLHVEGRLIKVPTDQIEMIPNSQVSILLSELNQIIAEQRGVSVQDLSVQPNSQKPSSDKLKDGATEVTELVKEVKDLSPKTGEENLTSEERAAKLRSDADRLYKEAAKLRKEAEELSPTKKKVKEEA